MLEGVASIEYLGGFNLALRFHNLKKHEFIQGGHISFSMVYIVLYFYSVSYFEQGQISSHKLLWSSDVTKITRLKVALGFK